MNEQRKEIPTGRKLAVLALGGLALCAVMTFAGLSLFHAAIGTAESPAQVLVTTYCTDCHNPSDYAGNIDFTSLDPTHAGDDIGIWETAVRKLRAGTMPPTGEPRPDSKELETLIASIDTSLDEAFAALAPDPGRVTARRLNRAEYENTVRDLLGVDFSASDAFPPDDTVHGFDNIAEMLTVSPTLMQQYLTAAETIAARAIGGNALPPPGFFSRSDRIRRIDANSISLTEELDYDAEYIVKVNLVGNRGDDDDPVELVLSVNGQTQLREVVPVQKSEVNKIGGATQRSSFEARVFLPAARHTFRADFVDDPFIESLEPGDYRNNNRNIFPDSIEIAGPYAPASGHQADKPLLVCDPAEGRACIDTILTDLVRRAYRRPVTRDEVEQYLGVYERAAALDFSREESLQFAVSAVLVSPDFLFRTESDPAPGQVREISDYELATRLSYFLWSSMPDEELFALADAAELQDAATIEAQVRRMLADPKATAFAQNFAGQWLETRSLEAISRDRERFPEWNNELGRAMAAETQLFFESVVDANAPVSDFIDGRYSYINGRLAQHYGIEGVDGEGFRRVELAGDQRSGVFTQASVLTVTSYPNRTSVVLRGKYLLDNVLSSPPPGPPADVPGLDEAAVGTTQSLREQMEAHRQNPSCAPCHVRMDPLGFALENYDATGKWRELDGAFAVDASGELPDGRSFDGPAQMKTLLLGNLGDFTAGLAEKMLMYALGRGVETPYDRKVLRDIVTRTADDDYRVQTLILEIAKSVPFRERKGEEVSLALAPGDSEEP